MMFLILMRANTYADLGPVWLRYRSALLHQKQLQFGGRHYHLDVDGLLDRAARTARQARASAAQTDRQARFTDRMRRATVDAIEHRARL
jgi:hypothetical protein